MGQRSQIYVRYNKKDMNGVNCKKLIANYIDIYNKTWYSLCIRLYHYFLYKEG